MKTNQKIKKGWITIPCDGEAHKNPNIDNCMVCAPRWGEIEVHERSFKIGAREAVKNMIKKDGANEQPLR